MKQNNSNIPIVKVDDTIYERYGSYNSQQLNTVKDLSKLIIEAGKLQNNKGIIKSKSMNKEN